jgi:hypothetical protein
MAQARRHEAIADDADFEAGDASGQHCCRPQQADALAPVRLPTASTVKRPGGAGPG